MSNIIIPEEIAPVSQTGRVDFSTRLHPEHAGSQACRLAVIYDDQEARNRVACLVDNLRRSLGRDIELAESWWKFSLLRQHGLGELAADDAARADLVLFSFGEGNDLPNDIAVFNDLWVKRRETQEGLLGILLNHSTVSIPRIESLREYFAGLARKAGLDFVTNLDSPQDHAPHSEHNPRLDRERILKPLIDEYYCPTDAFAS
jgi:hypothetical protein